MERAALPLHDEYVILPPDISSVSEAPVLFRFKELTNREIPKDVKTKRAERNRYLSDPDEGRQSTRRKEKR
jgi:hypothetical protein